MAAADFLEVNMKEVLERKAAEIQEKLDEMIPGHMHQAVLSWLWDGWMPGSFLEAVLNNDLRGAASCADVQNSVHLADWAKFFTWYMPSGCWGDAEKVRDWARSGGWNGMMKSQQLEPEYETKNV